MVELLLAVAKIQKQSRAFFKNSLKSDVWVRAAIRNGSIKNFEFFFWLPKNTIFFGMGWDETWIAGSTWGFSEIKPVNWQSWKIWCYIFMRSPKNIISKFSLEPFQKQDPKVLFRDKNSGRLQVAFFLRFRKGLKLFQSSNCTNNINRKYEKRRSIRRVKELGLLLPDEQHHSPFKAPSCPWPLYYRWYTFVTSFDPSSGADHRVQFPVEFPLDFRLLHHEI